MTTQKPNKATENAIRLIKKEIVNLYERGEHYPYYSDKLGKWGAGFTVEQLPNAKPSTIKEATSDRDYVYYLAFLLKADTTGKSYRHINGGGWFKVGFYLTGTSIGNAKKINTNGEKYLNQVWRNSDAEAIRKNAAKIFLIKAYPLYSADDLKKQEQRKQNPAPKTRAELEKDRYIYKVDRTLSNCSDAPDNAFYYRVNGNYYSRSNIYYDRLFNNITERRNELRRKYAELLKNRKKQELSAANDSELLKSLHSIYLSMYEIINNISAYEIVKHSKIIDLINQAASVARKAEKIKDNIKDFASIEERSSKIEKLKEEVNQIKLLNDNKSIIVNLNFRNFDVLTVNDGIITDKYNNDDFWTSRYITEYNTRTHTIIKGNPGRN